MTTPTAWMVRALGIDGEILDWASAEPRSVRVAWATCPRADWLLDLGARLQLDRIALVRAAAACLDRALVDAPPQGPARAAWHAAALWTQGQASTSACAALAEIALEAADEVPHDEGWAAIQAAAELALACDEVATAADWADAAHVLRAFRYASVEAPELLGREAADLVRLYLPYEALAPRLEPRRRRDPETARTVIETVGLASVRHRAS